MLECKGDFPLFERHPSLVYLDSAATTQKPREVIDALAHFYSFGYATVHRGVYDLSILATEQYEAVRLQVASFLGVDKDEIIFTRGTTDGINLLAQALSKMFEPGDEVILTAMEHHSNLVPWQMLQDKLGIVLKIAPLTDEGEICLKSYEALFTSKTRLASFTHISNLLGTINPVSTLVKIAKNRPGRPVLTLIDGAQAVAHSKVSLKEIGADFYLFSGHKVYGPTGVGVLYGKRELLEMLSPVQGGGSMVREVSFHKSLYQDPPLKFEAGTPMIAEVIGLGAALRYIEQIGLDQIDRHEQTLLTEALLKLSTISGLKILGAPEKRGALLSFVVEGFHPLDLASLLNLKEICIRSGHQCAEPLLKLLGYQSCCRISFGIYNQLSDIKKLSDALEELILELG